MFPHISTPVVLLSLPLAACSSAAQLASRERERQWRDVSTGRLSVVVDVSDGVSEFEAYKIAHDYFFATKHVADGAVGRPKEEKDVWRVPLLETIAGIRYRDVIVRKSDGTYSVENVGPQK